MDPRLPEKTLRTLLPYEVWRAHGHSGDSWRCLDEAGHDVDSIMRECARAMPFRTAQALVAAVAGECGEPRGWVCHDPDEEEAKALFRGWLQAWKGAPSAPGRDYLNWLEERQALRAGLAGAEVGTSRGRASPRSPRAAHARAERLAAEALVQPATLSRGLPPGPAGVVPPAVAQMQ